VIRNDRATGENWDKMPVNQLQDEFFLTFVLKTGRRLVCKTIDPRLGKK
jgi:hypothetical protein